MAPAAPPKDWRKSTYSMSNGQCAEVALGGGVVAVRDSKDPGGPVLEFSPADWERFTAALKAA